MNGFNNVLSQLLMDVSDGCYEFYDNYQWKMENTEIYNHKMLFRILSKDKCLNRMIKGNYYAKNTHLGPNFDFEAGFQGYNSLMKKSIEQIQ